MGGKVVFLVYDIHGHVLSTNLMIIGDSEEMMFLLHGGPSVRRELQSHLYDLLRFRAILRYGSYCI